MLYGTAITSFILTLNAFTGGFLSFIIELATRKFIKKYHLRKINLTFKVPRTAGTMRKAALKNITATCPSKARKIVGRLSKTAWRPSNVYHRRAQKECPERSCKTSLINYALK